MPHLKEVHLKPTRSLTSWVVAPPRHAPAVDAALLQSMFTGAVTVKVENAPRVDQLLAELFGLPLGAIDWGTLIGAPDEAIVHVAAVQIPNFLANPIQYLNAISVRCEHFYIDDYGVELQFYTQPGSRQVIAELVNFYLTDFAPAGLGSAMFARLAAAIGAAFGGAVAQVKTLAGRMLPEDEARHGRRLVGYYVWAALGFDQELAEIYRHDQPDPWSCLAEPSAPGWAACRTLQDLLQCEQGKAWWLENGRPAELWFDLRANSRSRQVLRASLCQKQLDAFCPA